MKILASWPQLLRPCRWSRTATAVISALVLASVTPGPVTIKLHAQPETRIKWPARPETPQQIPDSAPTSGPPLRLFDPDKDCACLRQRLAFLTAMRDGYGKLAASESNILRDLPASDGSNPPKWVDPSKLDSSQLKRLLLSKNDFATAENKLKQESYPPSDACFKGREDITMETDERTGNPPTPDKQREVKPLFPFEELFQAVMRHEYFHAGEWTNNNPSAGGSGSKLPNTMTPYGQALAEQDGYQHEIDSLSGLENRCYDWSGEITRVFTVKVERSGSSPAKPGVLGKAETFTWEETHTDQWIIEGEDKTLPGGILRGTWRGKVNGTRTTSTSSSFQIGGRGCSVLLETHRETKDIIEGTGAQKSQISVIVSNGIAQIEVTGIPAPPGRIKTTRTATGWRDVYEQDGHCGHHKQDDPPPPSDQPGIDAYRQPVFEITSKISPKDPDTLQSPAKPQPETHEVEGGMTTTTVSYRLHRRKRGG